MVTIQIYFGYQWDIYSSKTNKSRNNTSLAVFKKIETYILKIKKESSDNIRFGKLRASAWGLLYDVIIKRISESDILIFDIFQNNNNVWIEVGMALSARYLAGNPSKIFLLTESTTKELEFELPSDLQGYFLSH